MSETTPTVARFRPVEVPDRLDGTTDGDFRRMIEVRNTVLAEVSGHDDHTLTADEALPALRPDENTHREYWLALAGERIVGRLFLELPLERGSRVANVAVELVRAAWGRGIGTAALAHLEDAARSHGRSVLQAWIEHPAALGARVAAPTGYGTVARDHAARFALRHGFALEQIERISAYDLHAPELLLRAHLAAARATATGYRIVQWEMPTPAEFAPGYAWMKSRMSTDVPAAGLDVDEEVWDAARVRRHDASFVDGGRRLLVTAAQHELTGELCAFNELTIGTDPAQASFQEDTLVLAGHRGHRLGMLVKAEGLLAWRRLAPLSPRVITYNAEENRPMLDINEALGFVPLAYEGAWRKTLT